LDEQVPRNHEGQMAQRGQGVTLRHLWTEHHERSPGGFHAKPPVPQPFLTEPPRPVTKRHVTPFVHPRAKIRGRRNGMSRHLAIMALSVAVVALIPARAQQDGSADYPHRPVKIIVSTSAGGGVDTVTRIFAAQLQTRLGHPLVIENRGGGGGNIGAEAVYTADPDGYTLLASQPAPITSNIALYKKLTFDPAAFESVAVLSKFPNVLLVRQDFPVKTPQEFNAYGKAKSGQLTYASQGPGTTSHLTAELFSQLTGAKMVHIPYRGTGPALNDLVASHVDFIFMEIAHAYKLHEAGKARILAVATDRRLDALPDV